MNLLSSQEIKMKIIFFILLAFIFTGCDYIKVNSCNDGLMTAVLDGDVLSKSEENTRIRLVDTLDTKDICVLQGNAYIFRK